jgi:hypothetical protein
MSLDWSTVFEPLNLWLVAIAILAGIATSDRVGRFFLPDDFENDPVGWLTVQSGHLWIGVAMSMVVPSIWMAITKEFPDRVPMMFACIAAAAAFELCQYMRYGGSVWDKVADTAFMGLPPAGAVLSFQWQGGMNVSGSIAPALACLGFITVVAVIGAWRRA